MITDRELVPGALASWLEESLVAKLGRCRRCMMLSGALLLASWLLIYVLASMEPLIPALLVVATVAAVPITLLAAAHAVAFVLGSLRRFLALAEDGHPQPASDLLVPTLTQRPRGGGCGCGRASSQPPGAA